MSFVDTIRSRAATQRRRIALPETEDPRTLDAARALAEAKVVEPVLIGAPRASIPGCEVIDEAERSMDQIFVSARDRVEAAGVNGDPFRHQDLKSVLESALNIARSPLSA